MIVEMLLYSGDVDEVGVGDWWLVTSGWWLVK